MGANDTDITRLEDLPPEFEPYIENILLQLSSRGISIDASNQVTVPCYEPGSGIGDHVDAEALDKYVLDLNLRCSVPMHLRHLKRGTSLHPLDGLRFAYMFARGGLLVILACNSQNYHG